MINLNYNNCHDSDITAQISALKNLALTKTQLADLGYVVRSPTELEILDCQAGVKCSEGWEKCYRCTRRFRTSACPDVVVKAFPPCLFHPRGPYCPENSSLNVRSSARLFACCNNRLSHPGCTSRPFHVCRFTSPIRLSLSLRFLSTPFNPDVPRDFAVSLDCEMGYTTSDFELLRMTLLSWPDSRLLVDALVQPSAKIIDYNTEFSGITEQDFARATIKTPSEIVNSAKNFVGVRQSVRAVELSSSPLVKLESIADARETLFSLISCDTPVVGHSLNGDLLALRVIHQNIIDTAQLFRATDGSKRPKLRDLAAIYLNRIIQYSPNDFSLKCLHDVPQHVSNLDKSIGHDSREDALAAGDLAWFKVKKRLEEVVIV